MTLRRGKSYWVILPIKCTFLLSDQGENEESVEQ